MIEKKIKTTNRKGNKFIILLSNINVNVVSKRILDSNIISIYIYINNFPVRKK